MSKPSIHLAIQEIDGNYRATLIAPDRGPIREIVEPTLHRLLLTVADELDPHHARDAGAPWELAARHDEQTRRDVHAQLELAATAMGDPATLPAAVGHLVAAVDRLNRAGTSGAPEPKSRGAAETHYQMDPEKES